jgi:nucleoside-diphosphate kinase
MSSKELFIALSGSLVSIAGKSEIIFDFLGSDETIADIKQSKIVLNEEQYSNFPFESASVFCNGSVMAFHCKRIQTAAEDFNMDAIIKAHKLNKDDIFITDDSFFIAKLQRIFFANKPRFERTAVLCSPALSDDQWHAILDQLKLDGIFVLYHQQNVTSALHPELTSILLSDTDNHRNNDEDEDEEEDNKAFDSSLILCESFDCVHQISLLIGTQNKELCPQFAPLSWYNRYSYKQIAVAVAAADDSEENSNSNSNSVVENVSTECVRKWVQVANIAEYPNLVKVSALPTERTLALIKPTAVSKGFAAQILQDIERHGFTIIARKQVHLRVEHARAFYQEHDGKGFFEELTNFMSSGAIFALVLERVSAIKCWRTLLGPTNTFTAQQDAPQSIRARFGTDQTANACHGSDSTQSAKRELKFYFPEIAMGNQSQSQSQNNRKKLPVVQEYMSRALSGSNETLQQFLVRGLSELAKAKPGSKLEVVEWFAHWLLANNPSKPLIKEPESDFTKTPAFAQLSFVQKMQYLNGDSAELQIVFVLGGPGSGKGTQCLKIIDAFQYTHISVGDLCRKVRDDPNSAESAQLREIIASGKLASAEFVLALLEKEMLQQKGHKFLLDGFPRNLEQCIMFEKQLCPCKLAINFQCTDEILMKRCLDRGATANINDNTSEDQAGGRADDNRETIEKRLETFHNETDEAIEYLRSGNKLKDISAMLPIEQIWESVQHIRGI